MARISSRPNPRELEQDVLLVSHRVYRAKEVRAPPVALHFDGANFRSEVWVNGIQVGSIQGAFIRGRFDITKLVKPGETAVLAVTGFSATTSRGAA